MAPEAAEFKVEVDKGIAVLTLSRPERLNALTFSMYADLVNPPMVPRLPTNLVDLLASYGSSYST